MGDLHVDRGEGRWRRLLFRRRGPRFVQGDGAPGEGFDRAGHRREFQRGRHRLGPGGGARPAGIVDRGEHAVRDLAIAFADLVSLLLDQQLEFFIVGAHGVGEIREAERQDVGVGQPDDRRPTRLRERSPVGEIGVEKMCEEVKVVVDRVVDSVAVLAAVADVQ